MHDRFDGMDLDAIAGMAVAGDRHALDALLRRIRAQVLRRCARVLPYQADAEDACQEALIQVARRIGTFEGRAKFTTWLDPLVVRCALQTYRSLKRRAPEQPAEHPPVHPPDPRRTSVIAGTRVDLLEALEKLEHRNIDLVAPFVLRDLADLEYSDIVAHLGLPLSTIKFRIHQARKFIRRYLAQPPC